MYVCLCHGVSDKKIISTVHKTSNSNNQSIASNPTCRQLLW